MAKIQARKTNAARAVRLPAARRAPVVARGTRVCLGELVGWDERGPLVDFEGNGAGPVRARVAGGAAGIRSATTAGQEVVLLLDERPGRPPVLLGLLQPLDPAPELDARIDGKRVELEGKEEIVLRCGQASITLRANGRIVIRGVQVETRASGLNRIKGGSVAIN